MISRSLRESFIPILLVLGALFLLLLYVRYEANLEADQVTVITIQAPGSTAPVDDEEAMPSISTARSDDPRYLAAAKLAEAEHWQEAEAEYRRILAEAPSSQAWADLGVIRYRLEDYAEALADFDRAVNLEPVFVGAYFYRALAYKRLDRLAAAEADYRSLIAAAPYHFEGHYNLGLLLLQRGEYAQSAELLLKASELGGGERRARALYHHGEALLAQGKGYFGRARQSFERAIRLHPAFVEPRLALAEMEPDTAAGRESAAEWYQQALKLASGSPVNLAKIALGLRSRGRDDEAKTIYLKAIELDPTYTLAQYNLGVLMLDHKEWAQAAERFRTVLQYEPEHEQAWFNLGRSAFRLKDYEAAATHYQKAMALRGGDYPEALLNLGLVHSARNDYASAVAAYQRAIELQPGYASAWYNLGLAQRRRDDMPAAIQAFLSAINSRPDYPQAWYNLGLSYAAIGDNEQAIQAYEKAIELRPGYRSAQLNLAVRWSREGNDERAVAIYRDVLERHPTYSLAWGNLGQALQRLGRHEEAVEALSRAIELEPGNARAHALLASSLSELARFDEAFPRFQQALDMEPGDSELRLAYAHALRVAGSLSQAHEEAQKGLKLQPEHPGLQRELEVIEQAMGR